MDFTMNNTMNDAIEMAKEIVKVSNKTKKAGNMQFSSLSHVLKHVKSEEFWNAGFGKAFAAVSVTDPSQLTPAWFLNNLSAKCKKERKGKMMLCVWGLKTRKDEDGVPILDRTGNPIKDPVPRIVSSWSPNTILKLLAQSQAFRAQEQEANKVP